jgi:hypothetical protein
LLNSNDFTRISGNFMSYIITGTDSAGALSLKRDSAAAAIKKAVELMGDGCREVCITDPDGRVYSHAEFDQLRAAEGVMPGSNDDGRGQYRKAKMASKNSTLNAINRGGIATLADGTCWHISSSELLKAKNWRIGAAVMIQGHHLTNVETGVQIDVVPIPLSAER